MPRSSWRWVVVAVAVAAGGNVARGTPPLRPQTPYIPLGAPIDPANSLPTLGEEPTAPLKDLTPPGFATDAPAVHPAYRDVPGHLAPAAPEAGGPFASAEFLLLRARRGAFDYAIPGDGTGLVVSGPARSLNFDLQPGVRGELGYRFGHSGWEAYAGYTYSHSSATDAIAAPAGQVLFPTLTRPGLTDTVSMAVANGNLAYNVYDAMLGKRIALDENLAVRFAGGVRFANIRQAFSAYYDGLDAHAATVAANSTFNGFGPVVAGEAAWAGWKGLHVYARFGGGLLTGSSSNPLVETNNAGHTVYANTAYDIRKVVPMASAGVGAGWQYRAVSVRVGYEIANYFGLIEQPRFVDDIGVGHFTTRSANLSLEGLFVQVGLSF